MPDLSGTLKPPRLPAAPSSPVQGQMYFNTVTSKLQWWSGTAWVDATGGGAGAAEVAIQTAQPTGPVLWVDTDEDPAVVAPAAGTLLAVYQQEGENAAYSGGFITQQVVVVDAAWVKPLRWQYTPPVNAWAEVTFYIGLMQKIDAAYHYAQMYLTITPTPVSGAGGTITKMQHNSVQTFDYYSITKLFALTGNVAYTMGATVGVSGGSWQFHQAPANLWMTGKAWAR